ncbi:hypothetical protein STEG23_018781, partial [Scotinomys teguina]
RYRKSETEQFSTFNGTSILVSYISMLKDYFGKGGRKKCKSQKVMNDYKDAVIYRGKTIAPQAEVDALMRRKI